MPIENATLASREVRRSESFSGAKPTNATHYGCSQAVALVTRLRAPSHSLILSNVTQILLSNIIDSHTSTRLKFTNFLSTLLASMLHQKRYDPFTEFDALFCRKSPSSMQAVQPDWLADQIISDTREWRSRNNQPLISVAICTYNRPAQLRKALGALKSQSLAKSSFEIIVVDNSDLALPAGTASCTTDLPENGVLIRSTPPGLSRARNVALRVCRTKFLAFLDDDAVPNPAWLERLLVGLEANRDVGVVGGAIEPIWPTHPHDWVPEWTLPYLTILDLGEKQTVLAKDQYLFGTNIAFDTELLRRCGGFDEKLGRVGNHSLLGNEEIAVQDAARRLGRKVLYLPDVPVRHRVHAERLRPMWLASRIAWQAISDATRPATRSKLSECFAHLLLCAAKLGVIGETNRLLKLARQRHWRAAKQTFPAMLLQGLMAAHLVRMQPHQIEPSEREARLIGSALDLSVDRRLEGKNDQVYH